MTIETSNKAILYKKIAAVAGEIEAVEKDGRNKDQGYRYATPASVMQAVKPLMAKHGIAVVPHLVDFEAVDTGQTSRSGTPYILNRVSMHYHIIDGESGEEMIVPWQAQAGTYGDDKGLAKAQTIAIRTFFIQLFQIPAEDPEIDPDAGGRPPERVAQPRQQPARQSVAPRPVAPATTGNGTHTPKNAAEAEQRFYARYGDIVGGNTWERAAGFLRMPRMPKPTTIEGWIAAAEAVREQANRPQPAGSMTDEEREALFDEVDAAQEAK